MKAELDYLMQRPVEAVEMEGDDLVIDFEGDAKLTVKEYDGDDPEIVGLSLLSVVEEGEETFMKFGRSGEDLSHATHFTLIDQNYEIQLPGFDNEERDLSVPPHPDERTQPEPTTPEEPEAAPELEEEEESEPEAEPEK